MWHDGGVLGFSIFACQWHTTHTYTHTDPNACAQPEGQVWKGAGRKMVVIIVSSL